MNDAELDDLAAHGYGVRVGITECNGRGGTGVISGMTSRRAARAHVDQANAAVDQVMATERDKPD